MSSVPIGGSLAAGFRLVFRRPAAVAVWVVFHLATAVVTTAVLVSLGGDALQSLSRAGGNGGAVLAAFSRLLPAYLLVLAIVAITSSIIAAAINRAVLRPETSAFGYLRLSGDELRQLALGLIWGFIGFIVYVAAALLGGISLGLVSVAAQNSNIGIGVMAVVIAVVLGGFLMVMAPRLGLASAQTFDSGQLRPFASWTLTRGRYWPMLAIWVVTLLIGLAVYGATFGAMGIINMALDPRHAFSVTRTGDVTSMQAFLTPAVMAQMVIGAILNALLWPLTLAPFAAAYRAAAPGGERAAEVFS